MSVGRSCYCATAGTTMLGVAVVCGLAAALPFVLKTLKYQKLFQQQMSMQTPDPMLLQVLKGKIQAYSSAAGGSAVLGAIFPASFGLVCCAIAPFPETLD